MGEKKKKAIAQKSIILTRTYNITPKTQSELNSITRTKKKKKTDYA